MKLISIPEELQGLTRFNVSITNIEPINDRFSKCFIKILYPGLNRNQVYITKEVANEMSKTLKNIPIVGEYIETVEDFKGHGGKIEITEDEIKFIHTTKPYGFVPEDTEVSWQNVTESDGTVREYLTCTGYLWTGNYPEVRTVIEEGRPQSMELVEDSMEGYWKQEGQEGYFHITKAEFSALCILGQDVPPAFESANIGSYYVANPISFQKRFGKMFRDYEELKVTNFSANEGKDKNEGGQNMFQFKLNLGEDNLRHRVYNSLNPANEEGEREWKYSIANVTENNVLFVEESTGTGYFQDIALPSTTDAPIEWVASPQEVTIGHVEVTKAEFEELQTKYNELESKHQQLETDYNTLKEQSADAQQFAELQEENNKLKEYKAAAEKKNKEEIVTKFSAMLTKEEMKPYTDKLDDYTEEDLEAKLAVIAVKKVNYSDSAFIPEEGDKQSSGVDALMKQYA